MVSSIRLYFFFGIVFLLTACDPDPQATELSERWQGHDWSNNLPEIMLDINNDGEQERALVGIGKRTIMVAVYLQEDVSKMDFVEFFIDKPNQQNSICGTKAKLEVEAQNFSLTDNFDPQPQGYKHCQNCQGLKLIDEVGCDPFHIYWDHENKMLSWWRN